MIEKVKEQPPEPPRHFNPCVDIDLQTICLKCLEKDPGARYPGRLQRECGPDRLKPELQQVAVTVDWCYLHLNQAQTSPDTRCLPLR
jgi:hypothetical protein